MIASTPQAPYYAVIFTSTITESDSGYSEMADKMAELAATQEGFLGFESARESIGLTVSYWSSLEAIKIGKHIPSTLQPKVSAKVNGTLLLKLELQK